MRITNVLMQLLRTLYGKDIDHQELTEQNNRVDCIIPSSLTWVGTKNRNALIIENAPLWSHFKLSNFF